METIEKFTARIPTEFLSQIINGSGPHDYVDEDTEIWFEKLEKRAKRRHCHVIISPDDTEEYFTWHPDIIKLGCTVQDCTILFVRPEKIK